tara:strand:+ start:672 stop:836 length:165 start_codon:yes stop_codon:yes gene_type:complete
MVEGGYTEYGYRGLEELRTAQEKIVKLQKEIEELKQKLLEERQHRDRMFWKDRQ